METSGLIWSNFDLIRALMYVIITCKYKNDPIKEPRKSGNTVFQIILSVAMETSGRIWPNFELIQAFMHVLVDCKYEKDLMKKRRKCDVVIFSIKSLWDFFRRSRAANSVVYDRNSPNFELLRSLMYIIVTCKYEMNPIKNVRENVRMPFFPL